MTLLRARMYTGSGRATCLLCKTLIKKDQLQITMHGYRTAGSVHADRKDCEVKDGLQASDRG